MVFAGRVSGHHPPGVMRSRPARDEHRAVPERITWVGHATVLIEMDGVRLLTDPVLRPRLAHLRRHGAPPAAGVAQDIDAVLLSHVHADHLDVRSLRRVGRDALLVAPRGGGRAARRAGLARTIELEPGERIEGGAGSVTGSPAEHDGRRWPLGREGDCLGFVVAGSGRVYFAGDTDL